jgi:hypothetical protein
VRAAVAFYLLSGTKQENATAASGPLSYPVQGTKRAEEDLMPASFPMFFFLCVGAICCFSFLTVAMVAGVRQKEREAFYESETLKKIAETQGGGTNPALEYLREKEKIARAKRTDGIKLGGLVNVGVGVALMIFLAALAPHHPVFLVGLIPFFVGLALLAYAFYFAPKD